MAPNNIQTRDISNNTGQINIAGGDVTIGYTAEHVAKLIAQFSASFQVKPFDGRCPYKGLDIFEEDDAELFFGRENQTLDLVRRVSQSRAVFITGPSGSGKSSLVRAGLLPVLKQGAIKPMHSERWLYETIRPGRDPLVELARATASIASTLHAGEEVRERGLQDATVFSQWCEIALKDSRARRCVLFVDQFEEVFTQVNAEKERVAFLNLLTYAATAEKGRVIVLFAMRSDFLPNCAAYPQLNALLGGEFVQIGPMEPAELVSAIARPALQVGLRIDPDLIAQIINDMQGATGALPLMQFALKDLFDAQQAQGGLIAMTLNDYFQRGGIHQALERHADAVFTGLSEAEQKLAYSVFSSLVEVRQDPHITRRLALLAELVPAGQPAEGVRILVQKLANARLVTTDEKAGQETVTISHEKLIEAWSWLKQLVHDNKDVITLQSQIANDAKEWSDRQRDPSYLYNGARLGNVSEQLGAKKLALSGPAEEFIRIGRARKRRSQVFRTGGIAAIIVFLALAVFVFSRQASDNAQLATEAQKQAHNALARQLSTQAQALVSSGTPGVLPYLLALQSFKLLPTDESRQILWDNPLAHPVSLMQHVTPVLSVAFSRDGRYIMSKDMKTVQVWDAASGKPVAGAGSKNLDGADCGDCNLSIFSPGGRL